MLSFKSNLPSKIPPLIATIDSCLPTSIEMILISLGEICHLPLNVLIWCWPYWMSEANASAMNRLLERSKKSLSISAYGLPAKSMVVSLILILEMAGGNNNERD